MSSLGAAGAEGLPSEPIVIVDSLTVRFPSFYGDVPVLDRVSLTIDGGESLGVVGESGSGKTLLAQAILGLLPKTARASGRVLVTGVDVLGASDRELAHIRGRVVGGVFQDALMSLNPSRTIGGHFQDVWKSEDSTRQTWQSAAEASLAHVALPDTGRVLNSYPHELSGGMRQRALIALALVRRPALLIADEPTTALDSLVEVEVLGTLRRLRSELGLSMMLVSHDFDVISHMCSRVAVLYGGQLCEIGPTSDVIRVPLHRYTEGLLGSVRSLEDMATPLQPIPGVVPSPQDFGPGCRFLPRCTAGDQQCTLERPRVELNLAQAWCHHPSTMPVDTVPGVDHG
jgi:peptide/nickel transport system ATP-binding protein/peptide/nickel transport system permease protein